MRSSKFTSARYLLTLLATLFLLPQSFAQLTVTSGMTAASLAATITGPGITVSAPVLTCPGVANGTFNVSPGTLLGGGTTFAINNGIILTTGKATAAAGTETTLASTNDGFPGDPSLAALALTGTLYDGCSLEFDFTAVGTSISFNYIFGSEEYNHSTCGPYNDAFAFFISGPGITGTQNMALVPGTNIPVTVNSVNSGIPGAGYTLANCTAMGPGAPFSTYFADNTGGTRFTYKGFTTELAATHTVTPCGTYHLKMAITDAGNSLYDSGVFIEAGSLTTTSIPPGTVCVGGTTPFTPPVPGGTWTSSNTAVATIGSATGIATGVSAGTATITYGISTGCSLTTTITVNALAPVTGTAFMCTGSSTSLTDVVSGGTWSSGNIGVATVASLTGVVNGVSAGTAAITYTLPTGCFASTIVTVYPLPAAISGSSTICIGYTVILSDATAGGTWSSSNTAVATISAAGAATGVSSGTSTITYTSATGCTTAFPVTVNSFYTSILNAAICQGSSYTFGGTTYTIGGTYAHTFTTATCDSVVTLHLTVNLLSTTAIYDSICNGSSYTFNGTVYTTTGSYTYHTVNINGCDSAVTLNLFVKPVPPPPAIVSPVVYCQLQSAAPLNATGSSLSWYTTSTGGAGSAIPPVPSTTTAGTTTYYVSQVVGGCESPRAAIQVVVSPTPIAAINANRIFVCLYDTTSVYATFMPSASYSWSMPGTDIVTGTDTSQSLVLQFNTVGDHFIYLTVSANGSCFASDTILISVQPAPVVAFYVKPDVCLGDTVTVATSSTTSGVTNCLWNFGDATVITVTDGVSGGPYGVAWNTLGTHIITLSATTGQCYSKPVTDTVYVHPLPVATFSDLSPATICLGDSALLSATVNDPNDMYQWAPAHFFDNNDRSVIYGRIERVGYVTLTVTTPFGCHATDSLLITPQPCCDLLFPNAFTPNGDGVNDVFRPVPHAGHHPIHTFMVANRWGQIVYESVSDQAGWDGNFNGMQQDLGVYFYYIMYDCNGKAIEEKGEVTLIR